MYWCQFYECFSLKKKSKRDNDNYYKIKCLFFAVKVLITRVRIILC
jgi:hypothetical protein